MDYIAPWLGQYHINLGTILASAIVAVGASLVIFLLNRLLRRWLTAT
jgi:hypothetical protein